jgi:hypothetical protein
MHFTTPARRPNSAPALMTRLAAHQDGEQELPRLKDEVHG